MDNFNDAELARALNEYSQGKANFSAANVKQCRDSAKTAAKNKKVRTLDVLYTERTGRNINKPQFGMVLVKLMFDPATKRKPQHRPIVMFLDKVAGLAARNHQPITHAMWEYNQRSGHLDTFKPGAVSRRKDPFGQIVKKTGNRKAASSPPMRCDHSSSVHRFGGYIATACIKASSQGIQQFEIRASSGIRQLPASRPIE
jgi:hypothetical protein